jgi:phage tail sheath gpL-like
MSWITTKLLAYVSGAFLLALLAVSTYAYRQKQVAERVQAEHRATKLELDGAISSNRATTDQLAAMTRARNDLLLTRAAEKEAAEQAIAESREVAVTVFNELVDAKRRINAMTLNAGCAPVLAAQVCPEVVDELRRVP